MIILLVVTIIIGIKLIGTIGRVDVLLDDVTAKVKTLDRFFNLVDFAIYLFELIITINFVTNSKGISDFSAVSLISSMIPRSHSGSLYSSQGSLSP